MTRRGRVRAATDQGAEKISPTATAEQIFISFPVSFPTLTDNAKVGYLPPLSFQVSHNSLLQGITRKICSDNQIFFLNGFLFFASENSCLPLISSTVFTSRDEKIIHFLGT